MYQKNYTNYYKKPFNPKKAVKHFTDLDVYQKALEASVFVTVIMDTFYRPTAEIGRSSESRGRKGTRDMPPSVGNIGSRTVKEYIIKNMSALALAIPHQIAEAHSKRFGSGEECLLILDKVMLSCNKMVVYLDQTRDICQTGLELEQFEEQVKKYFFIRQKVLNLQRVWRKYIEINKQEQKPLR